MKRRTAITILSLVTLSLVVACGDTVASDSESADTGVTLNLGLTDAAGDDAEAVFEDESGVVFSITEARAWLRDIELEMPRGMNCQDFADVLAGGAQCKTTIDDSRDDARDSDDDDDFGVILIDGPIMVDLVTGETAPSLSDVRVPALAYDRVDFRMEPADEESSLLAAGDSLADNSLVVTASFELDGDASELVLAFDFNVDVRLEGLADGQVDDGDSLSCSSTWWAGSKASTRRAVSATAMATHAMISKTSSKTTSSVRAGSNTAVTEMSTARATNRSR